jgi:GT2 family glycosyltransferase
MDIQVVVPVYNAWEVTSRCIESLKKHNADDRILIIDDASTDPRLATLYLDLPAHWQVMRNQHNLGFVKTANRGLRNTGDHSLLLNSDTVVTTGWLDRFRDALRTVNDLGTATPWSNNAEICSLPQTLTNNPMPQNPDVVAEQLRQFHQPQYPEIPTAVGFAMLVSARAKQQVGYFDEATFGHGYGEENDYSLRISAGGLSNRLVDHAYVLHVGNQSFQALNLQPNEQTMQRLLAKHPDYLSLIQNFIENDPLAGLRQAIIDKISGF